MRLSEGADVVSTGGGGSGGCPLVFTIDGTDGGLVLVRCGNKGVVLGMVQLRCLLLFMAFVVCCFSCL